jgi:Flp pilus assembly protein TadG
MRKHVIERSRADRGSTMVEFSLIAFMFIIVLLGVVEMGRMVLVYTTVANAARAGARYAIVHGQDQAPPYRQGPANTGAVQAVATHFASAGLVNMSLVVVTVNYPNNDSNPGSPVTVTVSYPYDPLVSYFTSLLNNTLSSTSQGIITY